MIVQSNYTMIAVGDLEYDQVLKENMLLGQRFHHMHKQIGYKQHVNIPYMMGMMEAESIKSIPIQHRNVFQQ